MSNEKKLDQLEQELKDKEEYLKMILKNDAYLRRDFAHSRRFNEFESFKNYEIEQTELIIESLKYKISKLCNNWLKYPEHRPIEDDVIIARVDFNNEDGTGLDYLFYAGEVIIEEDEVKIFNGSSVSDMPEEFYWKYCGWEQL